MAIPQSDPATKNRLQALAAAAGVSPDVIAQAAYYNRPVLLKPRSGDDLPDADDDEDDAEEDDQDLKEILRNAPAWLVSTVFHMLLLIILGVLAISTGRQESEILVEASYTEPGVQLDNPAALEAEASPLENLSEDVITPQDLAPVDNPLAAPLQMADMQLALTPSLPAGPSTISDAPIGLALSGRQVGSKQALLGKYGGSGATEGAVELALAWLAKQQKADGSWSLSGPYSDGAREENVPAATAMALLAFQGYGDTHRSGKNAKVVAKGWNALLKMQRKDGLFSGVMASNSQMLYTHAQCAIAVCELYGMTNDSAFRGPAERAIEYAIASQDKQKGGWRYSPGMDSDTSVTGWFVMALQSARMAKLQVPEEVFKRITSYLDEASIDGGRRYGYWLVSGPTNAVCAEGLLCRQYLGWKQNDPRLVEGVGNLLKAHPIAYVKGDLQLGSTADQPDVYYWYYATQAAHHMEGSIWSEWNSVMKREVPAAQVKSGPEAGSWNPQNDAWGTTAGRLYVTCLSTYMLEVYYRHLPIYSGYKFVVGGERSMTPEQPVIASPEKEAGDKPDAEAGDKDESKPAASPDKSAKESTKAD